MVTKYRCKACNLILEGELTYSVCPACGVPQTAFEEYKDPIGIKRSKILGLHLHPISIHFPQAITGLIVFFLLLSFTPMNLYIKAAACMSYLTYLLPLSVIASVVTGLFDGKIRFRKLKAPYLKRKILLAIILLIISAAMPLLQHIHIEFKTLKIVLLILSVMAMIIQMALGMIGIKLLYAILPGK